MILIDLAEIAYIKISNDPIQFLPVPEVQIHLKGNPRVILLTGEEAKNLIEHFNQYSYDAENTTFIKLS